VGGPPSQDEARATYTAAFEQARAAHDIAGMAAAALALHGLQRFGIEAGRVPVMLHQAYTAAAEAPALRARLAAALARSWVYAYDAQRSEPFAAEAVAIADELADPMILADALGAQLACRWGPEHLPERTHITARLAEAVAHVEDVRTRLDAHLWRLTTAVETLDVTGMHRQLAAIDVLASETGDAVVQYFALTRRAMHALLTDDLDRARTLIDAADVLGYAAEIPDAFAVQHSLSAELARHAGDLDALRAEAELFEAFGVEHGVQSVLAEAAVQWLEAGDLERATRLTVQLAGGGLDVIPRDVDWMLSMTKIVDAAVGCGLVDIARDGLHRLAPYAGRAVPNAGAVVCVGVVDDFLWRAARCCADERAGQWRDAALAAYRRLGAPWLLARIDTDGTPAVTAPSRASEQRMHLRPVPGGAAWSVGRDGAEQLLPDMKGLHYLRAVLLRPGTDVAALDLSAMQSAGTVVESSAGEQVDRQALLAYRQRLRDLDEELTEAEDWSDPSRVDRLRSEREALLEEVRRATGLGGRRRTVAGSGERARVAVRKAISAALLRIEAADPATARLLRTSVRTGSTCRYEPDPDAAVVWRLD
jgi:hypothetical protein